MIVTLIQVLGGVAFVLAVLYIIDEDSKAKRRTRLEAAGLPGDTVAIAVTDLKPGMRAVGLPGTVTGTVNHGGYVTITTNSPVRGEFHTRRPDEAVYLR